MLFDAQKAHKIVAWILKRYLSTLISKRYLKIYKTKKESRCNDISLWKQGKSYPQDDICLLIWVEVGGENGKEGRSELYNFPLN